MSYMAGVARLLRTRAGPAATLGNTQLLPMITAELVPAARVAGVPMELFAATTSLKTAGRVPTPSAQQVAEARERFLVAIGHELATSQRRGQSAA